MRLSRDTIRKIKTVCRRVCGGRRSIEVGFRATGHFDQTTPNFLLWNPGADLDETVDLDLLCRDQIRASRGWVALDLYCYTPEELDCNVYVLLSPERTIAYASQDDGGHAAAIDRVLRAAGHPGYRG
jgi:hypothetical protein